MEATAPGHRLGVVFPAACDTGGVERITGALLRFLAARGHQAWFVGRHIDARTSATGVRVARLRSRRPWLPAALDFRQASRRALRDLSLDGSISMGVECEPAEVLWVHSVHAAYLASEGSVRRGRVQAPAQVRRFLARHQVLLALERSYFSRADARAVICTSSRERTDLVNRYGIDPSTVHVIPNGYDPHQFDAARAAHLRPEARNRMGLGDEDVSLAFVANELHRKGFETLLRAVAAAQRPRLRVDVVGRRPLDDYRPLISSLGLADRVRWHGAVQDVAVPLAGADALVLPTFYEPFGLVVIEALASGVPVVVSALAGAAPLVGEAGVVLGDPADVEELAAALRVVEDDRARAVMASHSAAAVAHLTWEHQLARVEQVLLDAGVRQP